MKKRKAVGILLLIIGPLMFLAGLGLLAIGLMFVFGFSGSPVDSSIFGYIAVYMVVLLAVTGIITTGGRYLLHPERESRSRKAVGWFLLIVGICAVVYPSTYIYHSISYGYFYGISHLIHMLVPAVIALGGWFLIKPVKNNESLPEQNEEPVYIIQV